jgi:cytochrome P450
MRSPFRYFVPDEALHSHLRTVEDFVEPFITQVLALTPAELDQKLSKSDTFIHALARFTRDPKVIRDQIMSILLAGRDTTASTLSWALLELAQKPQVVERLQSEIHEQLGPGQRIPTYQDLKDMRYLNHVIYETLRLYPVVPFNIRTALVDSTIPRGGGPDGLEPVAVKAGTGVGYSPLMIQRRRDLYPPISESFPHDPLEWVPERWATWTPKSWHYIPVSALLFRYAPRKLDRP